MTRKGLNCPYCGDIGWYADYNWYTGEPEQVQCEFCYTESNSVFNIRKKNNIPRKGKERSIQVWGCDLDDGSRINTGEDGIVSVVVHGDHTVSVTDENHNEKLVVGVYWVSYIPCQNLLVNN